MGELIELFVKGEQCLTDEELAQAAESWWQQGGELKMPLNHILHCLSCWKRFHETIRVLSGLEHFDS